MKKLIILSSILISTCTLSAQTVTPKANDINGRMQAFVEVLPDGYNPANKYPLLLFVHGSGELRTTARRQRYPAEIDDITAISNMAPFSYIRQKKTPNNFIMIGPQWFGWPGATLDIAPLYAWAIKTYSVDTSQVYITGLSMGGQLAWEAAGDATIGKFFAAVVPISGSGGTVATAMRTIAKNNTPIWAFHNKGDGTVTYMNTVNRINAINQAPAPVPAARMTLWEGGGHDAWTKAYDPAYREEGLNVWEWMLSKRRGNAPLPPNVPPVANAGKDVAITLPVASVALTGTGTDTDGSITSFLWTKTAGPASFTLSNPNIANPVLSNLVEGSYTFRLTVTDNRGGSHDDAVSVVVKPPVKQPLYIITLYKDSTYTLQPLP